MESLGDVLRERNLTRQIVLVLIDGNTFPLFRHKTNFNYNLVLIGSEEQKNLLHSRRPTGELLDLVSAQVPISYLSPYETRAPVTGSRFFGREHEISRIQANPDTNHAILGIHRIGKTSLLRETERILLEQEASTRVVYLECSDLLSTDDYIREVVRKLNPRELPRLELQKYVFFFPNFLERMRKQFKAKIIFLLDEIDNLVIMQRGDWELFRMLRASSNKGACQYIIAGFREAIRGQYMFDSPFYNFTQEIRLNEFTRQQARSLIVTPMVNLRVRFKNEEEVISRIYEETAGHPNLLQVTNQRILADIESGMFVTLFYGVLEPEAGILTYSNAGHPPPYLFSPDGNPDAIALPDSGMPLGVSDEASWQQAVQEIPPGAMLLLYTDGVIDAQNPFGEFLGEEGMLNIIQTRIGQSAVSVQETLLATLGDFAGAEPQVDDITLMTIIREKGSGTLK